MERRDVTKAYGTRLIFNAHGTGGKFDLATTAITLGSALGLMTVATLAADFFLSYLHPMRALYNKQKFGGEQEAEEAELEVERRLSNMNGGEYVQMN